MKTGLLLSFLLLSFVGFAQQIKIEDNQLVLDEPVQFKTGTADILPESETILKNVKAFLENKPFITLLRVEGHVSGGSQNQTLSESRAQAVVSWMVKNGIDCKRLLATGFGDSKPIVANNSTEKAKNNRIVFAVASLRNHVVGGMPVDGGGKVVGNACN